MIKGIITNKSELSKSCPELHDEDKRMEIINDLKDTAATLKNCAGLAAPQIGHSARAILVNVQGKTEIMVNPTIIKTKGKFTFGNESCFSVPISLTRPRRVKRWFKVKVTYWDEEGNLTGKLFKSFEARLIQHEIDHLDGILI